MDRGDERKTPHSARQKKRTQKGNNKVQKVQTTVPAQQVQLACAQFIVRAVYLSPSGLIAHLFLQVLGGVEQQRDEVQEYEYFPE